MKSRGKLVAAALAVCLLSGCAGVGTDKGEEPRAVTVLTIGTADSGGTMYPVGSGIAKVLEQEDWKINLCASTGSSMNVKNLIAGEVDLGLVAADIALRAYEEEGPGLRAVAAVFLSQSSWLAPANTDLVYVHQLEGMRLGVGPEGSGTERAALAGMAGARVDQNIVQLENCSLGAGADMVFQGQLDAVHSFTGVPVLAFSQLAEETPCRVLKYTDRELDRILKGSHVFVAATLPAGTYPGQQEPVDTFGAKCILCVDEHMDEELVYQLTRTLWQSRGELAAMHPAMEAMEEAGFMQEDLPIPLHPGAARFYGELAQNKEK